MIYHHSGFLSVAQLANSMGYSPQAIRKAISEERLDAYKVGNHYMVKCKDADKFIKEAKK